MKLERRLQIAVALLAACGALILGFSKGDMRLPMLALAGAAVGFFLTDVKGWFYLSSGAANVAGLLATLFALRNILPDFDDRQALFLSLSDLLVYLQIVLFLREKSPRIYGMISLLSFLQVSVAAVISLSSWFGLLMVLYLFFSIYTLSLFLLYREEYEHLPLTWQKDPARVVSNPRWPLLYQPFVFQPRNRKTGLVRLRGLRGQVVRTCLLSILIAPIVFLVVPRLSSRGGSWSSGSGLQTMIAFTEDVSLVGDQFSNVLHDPEEVMRVRFRDARTDRPYTMRNFDQVYFRGSSKNDTYENGHWSGSGIPLPEPTDPISDFELAQVSPTNDLVAVETVIEPLPTHGLEAKYSDALFGIYPFFGLESTAPIYFDPQAERLHCPELFRAERFTYYHITTGMKNGVQLGLRWTTKTRIPGEERNRLLSLPTAIGQDPLTGLKAVAAQVIAKLPREERKNPMSRAKALESHLRDSGIYKYSLGGQKPDSALDPAEDFVVNHKSGHCEFYATVLALMLRSQNVPARLVTGYRGGEWDLDTGECLVRQWHAHAWVEALIPPEFVPADFQPRPDRAWQPVGNFGGGRRGRRQHWVENFGVRSAWLRLDATPAGSIEDQSKWAEVKHIGELADVFWSQYVLGMNPKTQQDSVYSPLAGLFDATAWAIWWNDVKALLSGDLSGYRWISWQAGVVAFGGQILLVVLYKLIRRARRRRRLRSPAVSNTALLSEVLFYRRLEQLLATVNFRRSKKQTQREFATTVAAYLADSPVTARFAGIPRKLTEAFYRVRFGCHALSEEEHARIDFELDELDAAMREKQGLENEFEVAARNRQ